MVLDAELIAGEGRSEDFYRLSSRMFTRHPAGLTVMAFDLLWQDGQDLTALAYDARRDRLEALELADAACGRSTAEGEVPGLCLPRPAVTSGVRCVSAS